MATATRTWTEDRHELHDDVPRMSGLTGELPPLSLFSYVTNPVVLRLIVASHRAYIANHNRPPETRLIEERIREIEDYLEGIEA